MILVTGATGLLGSHVLYELTSSNKLVRALYRDHSKIDQVKKIFSYYKSDYLGLFNRIEWVQGDIIDYSNLLRCMKDVDQVYHTAGLVSFNDNDRKNLNKINIAGTANIVNACLETGANKLCHVSSIATLGELESNEPVKEDLIWNQGSSASAYAISKYKGEMEVWRGIYEGLNAIIVNPSVIIGPGMWMGQAGQLFNRILKGLSFFPVGSSGYVDVRDVATAMVMLTESSHTGERFILNSENISHQQYMNLLAGAMGLPEPLYKITPCIGGIACLAEAIRASLTGTSARINRRIMKVAQEKLSYSSEKVRKAIEINFLPIEASVKYTVQLYMNDAKAFL